MKEFQTGPRLIALFLFGLLLLSPPLLAVFRSEVLAAGIPLLFLYLFGAWALIIALLALAIERGRRIAPSPSGEAPPET